MRGLEPHRREFEEALPRILTHARISFRDIRCPHRREELTAEAVGLCWRWWIRLRERGKDPATFVSTLAAYAVRAARSGRRVCGQERAKDVLSPLAQARHGFSVGTLPTCSTLTDNPLAEALADNTRTPPHEQAGFRLDFPAWVGTYAERQRRIILVMMVGERTQAIARTFGISPARVSQLRREFSEDWVRFTGGPM